MGDDEYDMFDMMGGLFDEDDDSIGVGSGGSGGSGGSAGSGGSGGDSGSKGKRKDIGRRPQESRLTNCNLVGLQNLGATCYMNAFVQTMFFTPGMRLELFKLSSTDLGVPESGDLDAPGVRRIPLEVQRLFAEMTGLDKASVSTSRLTASFGWTGSQERHQHDAQELNRELFKAIEISLAGTTGADIIPTLYQGVEATTTVCSQCAYTSTRSEDFHDLLLNVTDVCDLASSLQDYTKDELLAGGDQYFCEACDKKVDATRSTKFRQLPPILSLGLNRFTYDMKRFARVKVTTEFAFPTSLDMAAYREAPAATAATATTPTIPRGADQDLGGGSGEGTSSMYHLYSVIIHQGGAGGGHYTALVRDFAALGKWVRPQARGGKSGKGAQQKDDGDTGLEGRSRGGGGVRGTDETASCNMGEGEGEGEGEDKGEGNWFRANDSYINCASPADLEQTFQGSGCAYMLFFVHEDHLKQCNANDAGLAIPPHLKSAIQAENETIGKVRTTAGGRARLVCLPGSGAPVPVDVPMPVPMPVVHRLICACAHVR